MTITLNHFISYLCGESVHSIFNFRGAHTRATSCERDAAALPRFLHLIVFVCGAVSDNLQNPNNIFTKLYFTMSCFAHNRKTPSQTFLACRMDLLCSSVTSLEIYRNCNEFRLIDS